MEKHLADSEHLLLNLHKVLMLKQVAADMKINLFEHEQNILQDKESYS
jgi:hypothetical protein